MLVFYSIMYLGLYPLIKCCCVQKKFAISGRSQGNTVNRRKCLKIRNLFVTMLTTREVTNRLNIGDHFKKTTAQDYHHKDRLMKNNMNLRIADMHHDKAHLCP